MSEYAREAAVEREQSLVLGIAAQILVAERLREEQAHEVYSAANLRWCIAKARQLVALSREEKP